VPVASVVELTVNVVYSPWHAVDGADTLKLLTLGVEFTVTFAVLLVETVLTQPDALVSELMVSTVVPALVYPLDWKVPVPGLPAVKLIVAVKPETVLGEPRL
jgi:hypothetical protein